MTNPLVIAHRGASSELPENTLPAFERAIELGADYVEFDVRLAPGDGQLVVSHRRVRCQAPGMPTLDDVLDLCTGRIGLAIEIKEWRATKATLDALDARRIDGPSLIAISFLPRVLMEARRRRPDIRAIQHTEYVPPFLAARLAWAAGFRDERATRRALDTARRLGLATAVYTVNEESRMRELRDAGVAAIFTDRPEVLRAVLAG